MMWNYIVHTPARAFHRASLKKYALQTLVLYPAKDIDSPRSISSYYSFLLQLTGEVYNLHIEMGMRRVPSR
jgi:hypothetical protein